MKKSITPLPLRILMLLIIPLLGLLTMVAFLGVALHQRTMQILIVEHNLAAMRSVVVSLDQELDERRQQLVEMAEVYQNNHIAFSEQVEFAGVFFDQGIMVLSSENGRVIFQESSIDPVWLYEQLEQRAANHSTVEYLPLLISHPQELVVATLYHVSSEESDEELIFIGLISQEQIRIPALLEGLHPDIHNTRVYLIDPSGQIVYHTDPGFIGEQAPQTDYIEEALEGRNTADRFLSPEGEDLIATYSPAGKIGLYLVQEEYWKEIFSPLMRISQVAPLLLVPGLLMALGVMWFGISQIVQPIQQLEARSSDLAWGNFESIQKPIAGIDEIRQLQKTLQLMAERIQITQAGMRHYIAAMTRGQEEERARLARELHDGMIQSLIALRHREERLKRHLSADAEGEALLHELRSMTNQAVDDLRRIIRAMRPVYLEEVGLAPAIETLGKDLKSEQGIAVHFSLEGMPQRLEMEQELALFRICQEALNNVSKHSRATDCWVTLRFDSEAVTLEVRDNGCGFIAPDRVTDLSEEGHFGLMGMAERALLIGAHLQIDAAPGKGTLIRLMLDAGPKLFRPKTGPLSSP